MIRTIKDLRIYLLDFNPDAVIMTDLDICFTAENGESLNETKRNTKEVWIYGGESNDERDICES